MSEPLKILFICSQNRWRSLTAEKMYLGFPGYAVRSAGTEENARVRVNEGHIGWADLIFTMEKRHNERLLDKFPDSLRGKKLICLHIDDDYQFMNSNLQEILRERLKPHIEVP
ncbi:MAG: protein tyrosine phosphatase [Verrucomicrobiota bacterium]